MGILFLLALAGFGYFIYRVTKEYYTTGSFPKFDEEKKMVEKYLPQTKKRASKITSLIFKKYRVTRYGND